jgi:hypothetical protein
MAGVAHKEITFTWDSGKDGWEILMRKGNDQLVIIRMYPESEYYKNGLQLNYKDLVIMEEIVQSICNLLENFVLSNVLDEHRYDLLMSSCHPYIKKSKKYPELKTFITGEEW